MIERWPTAIWAAGGLLFTLVGWSSRSAVLTVFGPETTVGGPENPRAGAVLPPLPLGYAGSELGVHFGFEWESP